MRSLFFLIFLIIVRCSNSLFINSLKNYNYSFITPKHFLNIHNNRFDSSLKGSFTKRLYKEVRRRIRISRETVEERRLRLEKEDRSKRDGLLLPPKTSYEIYIATENRPLNIIRDQFGKILSKLKVIGAENIHIYNIGLKSLVRPIKKKYEANFLLINLAVYPSLINFIRLKLIEETGVLRVLILRDDISDKERRIYRDNNLYVRHPFFNTELYKPYKERLKESPYV